jgi:hypothetical protein
MRPNRRYLDEIYCAAMRQLGSHGTWEPEKWLWPGDTGLFRRGVFTRLDRLPEDWKLDIHWTDAPAQTFGLDEAWEREDAVKGGASDLFEVLSASGEFERKVSGADELVFLARRGRWWSIRNVKMVLERIQQELEQWRIAETLICSVFETPSAAIALSSRSTGAFVVRVEANGVPHIGVRARGSVQTGRTSLRQSRRPMQLPPKQADGQCAPEDATHQERSAFAYTPLFGDGYRIAKRWWDLFGRASLTTLDGDPLHARAARSE